MTDQCYLLISYLKLKRLLFGTYIFLFLNIQKPRGVFRRVFHCGRGLDWLTYQIIDPLSGVLSVPLEALWRCRYHHRPQDLVGLPANPGGPPRRVSLTVYTSRGLFHLEPRVARKLDDAARRDGVSDERLEAGGWNSVKNNPPPRKLGLRGAAGCRPRNRDAEI